MQEYCEKKHCKSTWFTMKKSTQNGNPWDTTTTCLWWAQQDWATQPCQGQKIGCQTCYNLDIMEILLLRVVQIDKKGIFQTWRLGFEMLLNSCANGFGSPNKEHKTVCTIWNLKIHAKTILSTKLVWKELNAQVK